MADKPDRKDKVGYCRPPKAHQWQKGQPSPHPEGRPPGKARDNRLMKMLAKKVWVTAPDGSRVRRALGEVIDHRLVEAAANGDLKAIRMIKDLERAYERSRRERPPTLQELREQEAERVRRDEASAKLTAFLHSNLAMFEHIKRHDIGTIKEDRVILSDWVIEAFIATHSDSGLAKRYAAARANNGAQGDADKPPPLNSG